ncbi:single-stranded-DNA-specific exonuclease RecJ [bacterium]|nr:single-stranded-DNA-specific exonuclease RecJ [bacterium]
MKWVVKTHAEKSVVDALAECLQIPQIIAQILADHEIVTYDEARHYFRAGWDELHDPFLMKDMDKAADRVVRAVKDNETVLIYGDYDVDGTTSASLLVLFFRSIGLNVHYHIPNRLEEGYGLSETGLLKARDLGVSLIVTVDCGITAINEVALANSMGMDVIVSDHHEPGPKLPDAVAILDPKRSDCGYPFKQLAGVGVAYKLLMAVACRLEMNPDEIRSYLDLVALGSVADIVPLVDENRILVRLGMHWLNRLERAGIRALVESSGQLGKHLGTGQVVFVLAPRINAVGRMGSASRAVELLITDSDSEAREIAMVLESENQHRKNIDEETYQEALSILEANFDSQHHCAVVLEKEGWHSGVIGIVASRIAEAVYRPTVMIAVENGIGKGSARSIAAFDIYEAIRSCEHLLEGFGGHKYAAGLTIKPEMIDSFRTAFQAAAKDALCKEDFIQTLKVAAEIKLCEITDKVVRLLNEFSPFGPKNMRPVFLSRNVEVAGTPRIVGKNHLKLRVRQDGHVFDAIGFGLGNLLHHASSGGMIDLVYVVEENVWNGVARIQLRIRDLCSGST